jgi:hypothetical protein
VLIDPIRIFLLGSNANSIAPRDNIFRGKYVPEIYQLRSTIFERTLEARMRNMMFRAVKVGLMLLASATMLIASSSPPRAETGSVHISIAKAGFIVGVGGGQGILHFKGKNYRLSIGGVSVGTIGAAKADLVGHAYNLRSAEDIAGTYSAATASVAIAGGGKVARLQNAKGVVLELRGTQVGLELSAALSGLDISLR